MSDNMEYTLKIQSLVIDHIGVIKFKLYTILVYYITLSIQ